MKNFSDAFRIGVDAAEQASRNKREIRDVIESASRALNRETNGALSLYVGTSIGLGNWIPAAQLVLGAKQAPTDTWVCAKNAKAPNASTIRLARLDEPYDGYPLTITYDNRVSRCHNKEAFADAVFALLSNSWVGAQLMKLLSQADAGQRPESNQGFSP